MVCIYIASYRDVSFSFSRRTGDGDKAVKNTDRDRERKSDC